MNRTNILLYISTYLDLVKNKYKMNIASIIYYKLKTKCYFTLPHSVALNNQNTIKHFYNLLLICHSFMWHFSACRQNNV